MPQSASPKKTNARQQQSAAERTGRNILRYILDHPGATRRDTAQGLHLSFPNVCRLVVGFQEHDIVVEDDVKQTGKRGPNSKTLSLRAELGCTIGVDLESTHVRGIVLDFSNEIRSVFRQPITADADADSVVAMVVGAVRALVSSAREQNLQVFSIGLALPGPLLDQALGRVKTELQGGYAEMEFVPAVQAETEVDTCASPNDICFALGHQRMYHSRESRLEILVLNRFGLSVAIVRDAGFYSGHLGLLPYGCQVPVRHYRDVCTGGAILRLARSKSDTRQFHELISSPNDPLVKDWLAEAVPAFAQAIYSAAMMYSPDRLTIEGVFNRFPKEIRAEIIEMVEAEMGRTGMSSPEIRFFEGDDLMGARGAAFVARDQIADDVILGFVRAGRESRQPA